MEFFNDIIKRNIDDNSIIINNTNIDNDRRNDTYPDKFQNTYSAVHDSNINDQKNYGNNLSVGIYRYKFTNQFTEELFKFSKIHQYDHRKDFKEAWESWMTENGDLIDGEVRRLLNLGYDGDIIDKMFKSARYYFRKKSTEKKAPAVRRNYVGLNKDFLDAMDEHIKTGIISQDFKPSDGFDEFCKNNIELLKQEVQNLCNSGFTDSNEIKQKIKKTYKNRYFLIISK